MGLPILQLIPSPVGPELPFDLGQLVHFIVERLSETIECQQLVAK